MKHYKFFEYSECLDVKGNAVKVDDIFPGSQNLVQSFEVYLNKNGLSQVFNLTPTTIKAQNYVGVIKFKNYQFQILPKLLKDDSDEDNHILKNLTYMLSYTRHLNILDRDISVLAKSQNPFLELLIKNYADSLFEALKKQVARNYIKKEENINVIKGKLLFKEHIKYNMDNKAWFYCGYDEFSENNLLNQLFKFVSECLSQVTTSASTKKTLKYIKDILVDIDFKVIKPCDIKALKLTRTQSTFDKPYKLAKMFIENSSIDLRQRNFKTISIVFDMNLLFEEFIFELINKHKFWFDQNGVPIRKISAQKAKRLFRSSKDLLDKDSQILSSFKNTYSDILIEFDNNTFLILDTKYKLKSGERSDLDNQDIYQMLAYKAIHSNKDSQRWPEILLLYPEDKKRFAWAHYINTNIDTDNFVALGSVNLKQNLKANKEKLLEELKDIFKAVMNVSRS